MDNGFITVDPAPNSRFVWPFQCVKQFEICLKAILPQVCHCKFHKHGVACG